MSKQRTKSKASGPKNKRRRLFRSPIGPSRSNGRRADGTFEKGNTASLVHGGRSERVRRAELPDQEAVRTALREIAAGITADLGGLDSLSTIKRELITRFTEASAITTHVVDIIMREGPVTSKGRTRAAVTTYLSLIDRLSRLAQAIGMDRVPRKALSIEEFIAQRQQKTEESGNA